MARLKRGRIRSGRRIDMKGIQIDSDELELFKILSEHPGIDQVNSVMNKRYLHIFMSKTKINMELGQALARQIHEHGYDFVNASIVRNELHCFFVKAAFS